MIDTSKYEGHTPANLWGREIVAEGKRKIFLNTAWLSSIGNDVYSNEIDRKLMVDAPLLLEEVKRLRKALYEVTKTEFFSYLKDVRPNDFLTEILEEMKE